MHGTAAPYVLSQVLETAQLTGFTSSIGRSSTHRELVVDSSYIGYPIWAEMPMAVATHAKPTILEQYSRFERLFMLATEPTPRAYLALTDDEIRMFDRALFASTKLVYELKV